MVIEAHYNTNEQGCVSVKKWTVEEFCYSTNATCERIHHKHFLCNRDQGFLRGGRGCSQRSLRLSIHKAARRLSSLHRRRFQLEKIN